MSSVMLAGLLLVATGGEAGHVLIDMGTQRAILPHTTLTLTYTCAGTYYKSTYVAGSGVAEIGGLTQQIRDNVEVVRACQVYVQSNGSLSCTRPTSTSKPAGYRAVFTNDNDTASATARVEADCKTYSDHRR